MDKLKLEYVDIDSIKPYKNNAKIHTPEQIKQIKKSIEQFGMDDPIGIWKDEIVEGHGRLIACKELGYAEVPIVRLDHLTDEERKAYTLAHNKLTMNTDFDMDILGNELNDIIDIDMSDFGFDLDIEEKEVKEDNYDIEENIPEEPKAKLGDIYQLGKHRLMCGDSTNIEDVEKLSNGHNLDLLFTDPPYNVSIVGGSHALPAFKHRKAGKHTIQNDSMSDEDFKEFLNLAFKNASTVLKQGGAFYVWYASKEHINFEQQLTNNNMPVREQLIWVKNSLVLGRQDYQWMHEPCMYGWKDGASHYFIDNRKLTTIIEDKLDFDKMKKEEMKALLEEIYKFPNTLIRENRPVKSDMHPTMKPIRMCATLINNSSRPGEKVLDLFGGSGSTMIACEQLDRICYMMEYDPKYVDVIINRWETFTGEKAVKLN